MRVSRCCLCSVLGVVCGAGAMAAATPTASEILAEYTRAQDQIRGFTVHFAGEWYKDTNMTHTSYTEFGTRREYSDGWLSQDFDHVRTVWRATRWGQFVTGAKQFSRANPMYTLRAWNSGVFTQYDSASPRGVICRLPEHTVPYVRNPLLYMVSGNHCPEALGYFCEDWRRLDQRLAGAVLTLRPGMDRIGESQCYVVEADTRFGRIAAWFDPKRRYALAKAIVELTADDVYQDQSLVAAFRIDGCVLREEVLVESFTSVNGHWRPAKAKALHQISFPSGDYHRSEFSATFDSWTVNPDFDVQGAFVYSEFPNDSLWIYMDDQTQFRLWDSGRLTPTNMPMRGYKPKDPLRPWRPSATTPAPPSPEVRNSSVPKAQTSPALLIGGGALLLLASIAVYLLLNRALVH